MTLLLRPNRGGFLRPFGCGWFIREFLLGNGPHGSPSIDPEIGACQADIFRSYKMAIPSPRRAGSIVCVRQIHQLMGHNRCPSGKPLCEAHCWTDAQQHPKLWPARQGAWQARSLVQNFVQIARKSENRPAVPKKNPAWESGQIHKVPHPLVGQ